jgi:cyclopropane-fatty-acyl-phospholipid synthase
MNGEHILNNTFSQSWLDRAARSSILKIFSRLSEGELVLKEQGVLVDTFGQKGASLHGEINILDLRVYKRLLFGGSIASGETYTEHMWETSNLTNVVRIFARNMDTLDKWEARMSWLALPMRKLIHIAKRNTQTQAKKNIAAHYDLGNKLYTRFLDDSMMYSSAVYPSKNASLSDAQQHKLKLICEKLKLTDNDHLLEIGTGWGGLAVYAAKNYGCKVTTTTISEEQYQYSRELITSQGLDDKITLLKQDYRLLGGQYDKLVSIEMIEAVGKDYLPTFFNKCSSLLKKHGLMLLQSITIADNRYESYSKSVDFIQAHIFPGGFLPSQLVISQHLKKHTDMMVRDLHDIGLDYARTLKDWHCLLLENKQPLAADGYDERFMRLWRYYFSYCEGGFLERSISTVQLLISKPHFREELCR